LSQPAPSQPSNGSPLILAAPVPRQLKDYRDGKLLDIVRLSVSTDGKTIHGVDTAVPVSRTSRYTLDRVSGPAPVAGH